ncbi:MAG: S9 family peptidase [Deferribacteres bacterium]|nr:S9 family peptidase [Deferribacteres bacterium]
MKRALFILVAIAMTGLFVHSHASAQVRGKALYEKMTSERLVTSEGSSRVQWLPNGQGYLSTETDSKSGAKIFMRVDPKSGAQKPLFDETTTAAIRSAYNAAAPASGDGLPFTDFDFAMDGNAIKFSVDQKDYLYNLADNKLSFLNRPKVEPQPVSDDLMRNMRGSQLWNGEYSPDFRYFAFVKGYDLYMVDTRDGSEKRLTTGGNEKLFNARPDWVYPEEFSQTTAYWWSPNSKMIAYYQFDEGDVHKYPLVHDLKSEAHLELQSYPKAGETNPTVYLHIIDLESGKSVKVNTESTNQNYIVRPIWLRDSSGLTFQRLNRHQSHLELLVADPKSGAVRKILEEKEEAFVNLHDDFHLLADGKHFIWSSERTGWRQLYLYDLQGKLVRQLTDGEQPVSSLTAVDEKGKWIYYTANTSMGLETHFFRIKFDGGKAQKLTDAEGSHRISMDPAAKYYVDSFSSFDTPPMANLHEANGKKIRTLMSSSTEKLDALDLEEPELVIVKAADGKTDLHGLLYKPAGFDPTQKYPLIVSVYGGPHSKSVRNSYQKSGYLQMMAQLGYMIWSQDNRGLRNRGKTFETETYLKLGQIDLADQAAGVKQISERSYIDGSRVGVFGGSYGGYMTCLALLKEPDVFHVGVAHAPVTDWRNYDTIYTERYMRTPQENADGYDTGSALKFAENLQGKLLITHGSVDNNVHPGNTIQLIEELVKAGKYFDLMFYPEQRHGVRGAGRAHLSNLRLNYFEKHLQPQPTPPTM